MVNIDIIIYQYLTSTIESCLPYKNLHQIFFWYLYRWVTTIFIWDHSDFSRLSAHILQIRPAVTQCWSIDFLRINEIGLAEHVSPLAQPRLECDYYAS